MAPPSISVPRQGLTGGAAVTLIAEGIAVPAGLITAMVMARGLGPDVYGRFAVVATTVALGEWLLIALFAPAVVRFVAAAEQWRPVAASSFRVYVGSGLAVAAALWTLAHPIALALDDAALAGDLRLFAAQVPVFAAGAASRNILAGQGRYRQQAVASAAGWIGRAAFIVLFIELQFGLPGAILGSFCGTLVGALVAVACVGPAVVGRGGLPSRQLMQLALPVFLGLVCARALERMGLFVLQAVGTAKADVGYYGAALNVMQVSGVIAAGIVPVLISTLTDASRRGDTARIRHVSAGAMRLGIVLLPMAAIGAGSSKDLVELLFGREFLAAAPLLASLVVASVALAMNGLMGGVLIAVNRPWVAAWVVMILSVIGFGVQMMVIPSYGASGAAQSTMVLALAAAAASAWAVSAAVSVAVPTRTFVRSTAFTALAYALSLVWDAPGPMVLVKVAALSLGVAVAFALTGELSKHEWSALGRVVSRPPSGSDRTTR